MSITVTPESTVGHRPLRSQSGKCIGMTGDKSIGSICKRRVVWEILGTGKMCNCCFETYFSINWRKVDIAQVVRLSDDDRDFFHGNEGQRQEQGTK